MRQLFRAKKAGHTGSLDPLATGMLPICFGEATKLCGQLLDSDKTYEATVTLGQKTTTGDVEGDVIAQSDPTSLDLAAFEAVRARFLGKITQIPPMYSALKHNGQRLYELARAGEEVERAPREVSIHGLELLAMKDVKLDIRVACSKGTYIRTLAEDLAAAVGQQAHLSRLRRIEVSPFNGLRMWTLEELEGLVDDQDQSERSARPGLEGCLLPLSAAVHGWPQLRLSDPELSRIAKGQALPFSGQMHTSRMPQTPAKSAQVAVMDERGVLKALAELDADAQIIPKRWLGGTN